MLVLSELMTAALIPFEWLGQLIQGQWAWTHVGYALGLISLMHFGSWLYEQRMNCDTNWCQLLGQLSGLSKIKEYFMSRWLQVHVASFIWYKAIFEQKLIKILTTVGFLYIGFYLMNTNAYALGFCKLIVALGVPISLGIMGQWLYRQSRKQNKLSNTE